MEDGVVVVAVAGREEPGEVAVLTLVVVEGAGGEVDEPQRERGSHERAIGERLARHERGADPAKRLVPVPAGPAEAGRCLGSGRGGAHRAPSAALTAARCETT